MYGLPFGNDLFGYVDPIMIIIIMFVTGLYSTTLALFIASFSKPKSMTTWIVLVFTLLLTGILLFEMMGKEWLYDPSIIPSGFLRMLIRIIVPYFPIIQVSSSTLGS